MKGRIVLGTVITVVGFVSWSIVAFMTGYWPVQVMIAIGCGVGAFVMWVAILQNDGGGHDK